MANAKRVGGVDLVRGIVLIAIMIDHVPGNDLEWLTPRNFALSDSAEAFVFLSGVAVGLVYYRRALASGLRAATGACLRRAGRLYGYHVALTLGAVAIFGAVYWLSGLATLIEAHGRDVVFYEPLRGAVGVALLSHQLGYFNILPLYIVLMALAPAILAVARVNPLLALSVSTTAYVAARLFDLNMPNWPQAGGWFLNPFAWQFIFTLGVVAAIRWRDRPLPATPALRAASLALVVAGAIVTSDGFGFFPGLRDQASAWLDHSKQDLGAARILNFVALAYLVATTPALTKLTQTAVGEELQRLGRHSLEVFAFGSLLAALGQASFAAVSAVAPDGLAGHLELVYILICIGGLFALARFLEWRTTPRNGRHEAYA